MFIITEIGGKQYKIRENDRILTNISHKNIKVGEFIRLYKVLLLSDRKKTVIGSPYILGVDVVAEVIEKKFNAAMPSKKNVYGVPGKPKSRIPLTALKIVKIHDLADDVERE